MMIPSGPTRVPVLLVDDLEENLLALSALVSSSEVEVLTAGSGIEALELVLRHDVALALVDVQMPDMDGFELAELMRGSSKTAHIPIIFVTAGAWERRSLFRGYDAGAVDFLFKPVDPNILRHKVKTFVVLHQQRSELAEKMASLQASEAQSRALQAELSATLTLNETFVAAITHDLRSPLNSIVLALDMLRMRALAEAELGLVERAGRSARRLSHMVDQLMDLSRARLAGGIPLSAIGEVDLAELVERVVSSDLAGASAERPIHVVREGDTTGSWDVERLSRVASNLVGNALRHGTPSSTVFVRVSGNEGDYVSLDVENSGEIPQELLPQLFSPFVGRSAGAPRSDGLGLGLYIVSEIVAAHGGSVRASSDAGRTTFSVRLPRAQTHAPTGPSRA